MFFSSSPGGVPSGAPSSLIASHPSTTGGWGSIFRIGKRIAMTISASMARNSAKTWPSDAIAVAAIASDVVANAVAVAAIAPEVGANAVAVASIAPGVVANAVAVASIAPEVIANA